MERVNNMGNMREPQMNSSKVEDKQKNKMNKTENQVEKARNQIASQKTLGVPPQP